MESLVTYTQAQWVLVLASFVMAAFALFAGFLFLFSTRSELSSRYRPSGVAGAAVCIVAFLAYLLLIISWVTGFHFSGGGAAGTYTASDSALQFRNGYRYVDWSVTVPILTMELAAVSTLAGRVARNTRFIWVSLAFLMIVTGYLGEDTFGDSNTGRLVWGLISTAFFIPLYVMLLRTALRSSRELPEGAGRHLRGAGLLLSLTWGVYPIAYCVPFFFADSAGWAVGRQLAFTVADVAAKVGYGMFIHSVAKARTAIDVAAAESPSPDAVYINSEKVAEAQPVIPAERVAGRYGQPVGAGVASGVANGAMGDGADGFDGSGDPPVR